MRVSKAVLFACVVALALPIAANAASPMKAGKWQITMETEMPGMPAKVPPVTMTQCVSKEEAANPQPPKTDKNSDCTITDYKLDGNVVTWAIECKKEEMTGTGKLVFSADAYEGVTNLKIGDMDMTQKFTGKFLGACDAK
jgi:hypothetical protein